MSKIVSKFNFKNNKKGSISLSLETLIRLMLSGLILIVLLGIFLSIINLDRLDNKNIAIQNAKSIGEFIEYSLENPNLNNCYFMLRLYNLENFQSNDKDNMFVYILTRDGVFVEPLSFSRNLNQRLNLRKPIFTFDKNINIISDDTSNGVFGFFSDSQINLGGDISYILFRPDYNDFKSDLIDNQNNLESIYLNNQGISKEISGNYLVVHRFGSQSNIFVTNGLFSNNYIKNNLCVIEQISSQARIRNLMSGNGENIDYINYKVSWNLVNSNGENSKFNFKWEGKAKCFKDDEEMKCDDLFKGLSQYNQGKKITYHNFIELIKEFALVNKGAGDESLTLIHRPEAYNLEEIQDLSNINIFVFENLFDELKIEDKSVNIEKEEKNLNLYVRTGLKEYNFNGCTEICSKIYIQNNNVYFNLFPNYVNFRKFYSFNTNFLRKDLEDNIYFSGVKLEVEKVNFRQKGFLNSLSQGEEFYKVKFDFSKFGENFQFEWREFERRNFDIILSKRQFENIEILR